MATTLKIVKGSTEVSLWDASGFSTLIGGFGMGVAEGEPGIVRERIKCKLISTSKDNAASQITTINRLLRDAYLYNLGDPVQTTPVYIKTQIDGETNPRYALIAGDYINFRKSPYDRASVDSDIYPNVEVMLIREHPWRSHKPGLLPGRINLLATNGPDFMTSRGNRSVDLTSTFGHVPTEMTGGIIGDDGYPFGSVAREFTRNMVVNPSFEVNVTDGWSDVLVDAFTRDTSKYYYGLACAHLDENDSGGAHVEYIQTDFMPVYPGATYTASLLYQQDMPSAAKRGGMAIGWYTSVPAWIGSDDGDFLDGDISTWTPHAVTGVAPDTAMYARILVWGDNVEVADVYDIWVDGVQFERGRYATDYCDGIQENCAWEGETHNSMSIRMGTAQERRAVQVAEATTNQICDPYFGYPDITQSWIVVNTNGLRDSTQAVFGSHSAKIEALGSQQQIRTKAPDDYTLGDGDTITLSGRIRCDADPGTEKVNIFLYDATNAGNVGSAHATAASEDDWEFVTVSWTNDTGLAADIRVYCRNAVNDSSTIAWFDCLQLEEKDYPTPWCCGDLGAGHAWAGTANDSTSTRVDVTLTYSLDLTDAFTVGFRWKMPLKPSEMPTNQAMFDWYADASNYIIAYWNASVDELVVAGSINGDGFSKQCSIAGDISRETWYWILFKFEDPTLSIYINNVAEATDTLANGTWGLKSGTLDIGHAYGGGADGNGWIDDLFILSRAWSTTEQTDYYESGKPFAGDPSILIHLPFNGPQRTHIGNLHEDVGPEIDVIWNYDNSGGPAYSDNYAFSENWQTFDVDTVAVNDGILIGSTHGPFNHLVLNMIGAGDLTTTTLVLSYWTGGAWTVLTLGDDYTILGAETLEEAFEAEGEVVINLFPSDTAYDWAAVAQNGVTAYYLFIQETHAAPVYATYPVVGGYHAYAPRTNHIRIPATALHGDAPPTTLLRLVSPFGGDDDEGPANISRILWGIKSRNLDGFHSFLNIGGTYLPLGWAVVADTDATITADGRAGGGNHMAVDYATDETLCSRATLNGTSRLPYFRGDFKVFLLAQQVGGTEGAVALMVRTYIGSTDPESPHLDTATVHLTDKDLGWEILDLGTLNIPFSTISEIESFAATDLIFEIHADRDTGDAATLEINGLILIPIDEASGAMDDAKPDTLYGSMALRGNEAIDHDAGVILRRTNKVVLGSVGNDYRSVLDWDSGGAFIEFNRLDEEARVYFILLHYPTGETWGTGPLIATKGCHVAAELQLVHRYNLLRGND